MTGERDTDRILEAWLRPGPSGMTTDQLASLLVRIDRTPQRRHLHRLRGFAGGRRHLLATGAALAATVIIAVSGAALFADRFGTTPPAGPAGTVGPSPVSVEVALDIADVSFVQTALAVPAGQPFTIRLSIADTAPHAIRIDDASGRSVFESEAVAGVAERSLLVPALASGRYSVTDPIHPLMSSALFVGEPVADETHSPTPEPSADPAVTPARSGAPSGSPVVRVEARNLQFTTGSTGAVDPGAGRAFTLNLVNRDATVPHGIVITDATGAVVFRGEIVIGPADVSYPVPALHAGTYALSCPVHPSMTASLIVRP